MAEDWPDRQQFRNVMGRFATGVTVVTTALEGKLHGITVSSFCSVSLEPPLVLVCIDQTARSRPLIAESGIFAVNVLTWQQQFLADRFAGRGPLVNTTFDGVPYGAGTTGAPVLRDVAAWVDCRVTQTELVGDHIIFVGQVVDAGMDEALEPLLYFQGRFHRLPPAR